MSKIGGFSTYQNYYENSLPAKKSKESQDVKKNQTPAGWNTDSVKLERSTKAENKNQVELSDAAQSLLKELKEKYSNMDFIIADYSTDEEAQQLLARGTKDYSVLMDPATLEKMAADENVKAQYLDIIEQSTSQLNEMKDELKDSGQDVKRIGFTVGDDGQVSFFAELEKTSKEQNERLEEQREKKRAEKKEEQKKANEERYGNSPDSVKRTTVTAASVKELLEKIRNIDWDSIAEEVIPNAGTRIDFSV